MTGIQSPTAPFWGGIILFGVIWAWYTVSDWRKKH